MNTLDSEFFELSNDLLCIAKVSGHFLEINQSWSRTLGWSIEELTHVPFVHFVHPDDVAATLEETQSLAEGKNTLSFENRYRCKNGEYRNLLWRCSSDKERGLIFAVARDITDLRQKEKLIEEQKVKMINSARLSSLGEMAAGIAHEINNPLTIIDSIIFQTTTSMDRKQFDLQQLPAVFDRMSKALDRIAKIVRSLRFFSRNSENDPFTLVSLNSIFQDAGELCSEKFRLGEVQLTLPKIENINILCRPSEIGQVLINLVTNSYDAVRGTPGAWVRVDTESRGSRIAITVTDSGNGIPKEIQKLMMNPFFTTKEIGYGTGLGLSIALGIVRSHGGHLIYDEIGGNTRFTFDLPMGQI